MKAICRKEQEFSSALSRALLGCAAATWESHGEGRFVTEYPANTEAIWKGFGLCGLPLWAEILQVQWDGRAKTRRKSSSVVGTNGCSDSRYGVCSFFPI